GGPGPHLHRRERARRGAFLLAPLPVGAAGSAVRVGSGGTGGRCGGGRRRAPPGDSSGDWHPLSHRGVFVRGGKAPWVSLGPRPPLFAGACMKKTVLPRG